MTDTPGAMRLMAGWMQRVVRWAGRFHDMETGARRCVRALEDTGLVERRFNGSPRPGLTGERVDQSGGLPRSW